MKKIICLFLITFVNLFSNQVFVIGISGGSGSGKTTLARKLHEAFPEESIVICQDSFYKDLSYLPIEKRAHENFDHPDSIEFSLIEKQLRALKSFESIDLPEYDFKTHTRLSTSIFLEPKKIIILEGSMLLSEPHIRDLLDIKLFVQAPDDVRLIRRIHRDQSERGRSVPSILSQYTSTVRPMHHSFIEPSKSYADLIIPEGGENRIALDLLISKIETELKK